MTRATTAAAGVTATSTGVAIGGSLAAGGGVAAAAATVAGEIVGGATLGAVTAVTTGTASAGTLSGAATASVFAGPIGLAILGADGYTWDYWKPVVMDDSVGLSRGIALRDLYNHPNLRQMASDGGGFVAEKVRGKQLRLSRVSADGALAFHATLI